MPGVIDVCADAIIPTVKKAEKMKRFIAELLSGELYSAARNELGA
jgi:hypothetical protein